MLSHASVITYNSDTCVCEKFIDMNGKAHDVGDDDDDDVILYRGLISHQAVVVI
jgi:hypothetical protein